VRIILENYFGIGMCCRYCFIRCVLLSATKDCWDEMHFSRVEIDGVELANSASNGWYDSPMRKSSFASCLLFALIHPARNFVSVQSCKLYVARCVYSV